MNQEDFKALIQHFESTLSVEQMAIFAVILRETTNQIAAANELTQMATSQADKLVDLATTANNRANAVLLAAMPVYGWA